ncbi:Transmembrane protein 41B [Homalodisca vitripennis]|nr:Transmembrane protein 41B [Homalodisca vitripennis]
MALYVGLGPDCHWLQWSGDWPPGAALVIQCFGLQTEQQKEVRKREVGALFVMHQFVDVQAEKRHRKICTTQLQMSESVSTRSAVIIIASIFVCSILALTYIYFKFPELEPEEKKHIKLPWDVEEAKELGRVLEKHKDRNYYEVLAAVVVTYIFLQTFAIPGSISLSILSGFLFPFPLALGLVCFCSATGASFCYLLSHLAGRRLVYKYFPDRAIRYSLMVKKHRHNIFNYILFLRITPFLPNWFINIAAPLVNVPIAPFWLGTFIGRSSINNL